MSQSEIAEARQLIRPILAGQLSLYRAVYAPTDHTAETERIRQALVEFDRLVQAALSAQEEKIDVPSKSRAA
jgi:hypothetical protein